ncbi:MAG: hypothetical protein KGJ62_06680 [Armatimonadetes bacterium]|nr:hypothetical protein [Armatimonadota bacterium]MDE2207936.1 hypothetical protein [Armatimonadota bacterium]
MMIACIYIPQIGIACERRLRKLESGVPVALADAEGRLLTVSPQAERFGVCPGILASGARALCPDLQIAAYQRELYEETAAGIWNLLAVESSYVEPETPERCFAALDGRQISHRVQKLVESAGGIVGAPVYAALASSKLTAAQSARQAEPGRVERVLPGTEAEVLAPTLLGAVRQIPEATVRRLERLGVRTLGDLLQLPVCELQRQFAGPGLLLRRLAMGEDGDSVRALWPPRVIERSVAFDDEAVYDTTIWAALSRCAAGISAGLLRGGDYARTIALQVELADGSRLQISEKPHAPLQSAVDLHQAALRLLARLALQAPVARVTLQAAGLGSGSGVQLELLDTAGVLFGLPHERQSRLDAALERLKRRYGGKTIQTGSEISSPLRIRLWVGPLGRRLDEPVQVTTDSQGAPLCCWRRGRPCRVVHIQNMWRETEWQEGVTAQQSVYRVETDTLGMLELVQAASGWRLGALAD